MVAVIKFENGYFMAPNNIFDIDLKIHEKIVYLYLCRCGNNSTAFPSYNTIAKKCSISRRKAIDAVAMLEGTGLLKKIYRKNELDENMSNVYEVIPPSAPHAPRSAGYAPGSAEYAPNKELGINELGYKEKNIYIISNENDVFAYYSRKFKDKFGKDHPSMNEEKMDELRSNFEDLSVRFDIDQEQWIDAVDYHFEHLSQNNNGNILSFLAMNGGHSCVYRYLEDMAAEYEY
jgi:hypothetical protein